MNRQQPNKPLHGIMLERMLTWLVEHYGWEEMEIVEQIKAEVS
jgi:uncharacterized protein (DUF2132 family)